MNNLEKGFTPKEELMKNLTWLIQHDPERFEFLEMFMRSIANNEPISVGMSLNNTTHDVTVSFKGYSYVEKFNTLDDAMVLVDMVKSVKKEVA